MKQIKHIQNSPPAHLRYASPSLFEREELPEPVEGGNPACGVGGELKNMNLKKLKYEEQNKQKHD